MNYEERCVKCDRFPEYCDCGVGMAAVALVVGIVATLVFLVVLLSACGGAQLAAGCDVSTLTGVTALCQRAVRRECPRSELGGVSVPEAGCDVLRACDAVIDEWQSCASGGEGGARSVPVASGAVGGAS